MGSATASIAAQERRPVRLLTFLPGLRVDQFCRRSRGKNNVEDHG